MSRGWAITPSGEYPADWKEIATEVKEEVGWRCIRCGHRHSTPNHPQPCDEGCDASRHTNGKLHDGKQRILTVHHLTGEKDNCQWWNILPLCQVCHFKIQIKVNPERPWVFEHSEWFKPYVCGWYAWRYFGLHLTREQVFEDDWNRELLLSIERLA